MRTSRILALSAVCWLASCGQAPSKVHQTEDPHTRSSADSPQATVLTASDLRNFLLSQPGTYGWKTADDSIMLDFMSDGRLHIQGPDGEATMWEGHWGLHDDGTLTLFRTDLDREQTLPVVREGDALRIGDKRYTRFRP